MTLGMLSFHFSSSRQVQTADGYGGRIDTPLGSGVVAQAEGHHHPRDHAHAAGAHSHQDSAHHLVLFKPLKADGRHGAQGKGGGQHPQTGHDGPRNPRRPDARKGGAVKA